MSQDPAAGAAPQGATSGLSIAGAPNGSVDPNEGITLIAIAANPGSVSWQGGGVPASGTGRSFTTRFPLPGRHDVTASVAIEAGPGETASVTIAVREPSGLAWCARFPGSAATADLQPAFRQGAESFVAALRAAGAQVQIDATLRPPERAYLMHFAGEIGNIGANAATIPGRPGVEIAWAHRDSNGNPDSAASQAAARDMTGSRGFDIAFPAVLESRHTEGRAVDMTISWAGNLTIVDGHGRKVAIASTPRTGMNTDLHAVGRSYGVIKLVEDPPHWSDDGH